VAAKPRFALLEVVRVAPPPGVVRDDQQGQTGVVCQVRVYPDGTFSYSLGRMVDGGALYPEEWLEPTGDQASLDDLRLPGPLQFGDIVAILPTANDAELRGKGGVICGASEYVDPSSYAVWVGDLNRVFMVDGHDITSTGRREPPQPIPRTVRSTRVGEDGEVRGQDEYVVLDEIEAHW
jgi:hypothetical protein